MTARELDVAVFMPSLAGGGAERVTLALLESLRRRGVRVTLLLAHTSGELAGSVPEQVRVVDLGTGRVVTALRPLRRYLAAERPDVLVGVLAHANIVAVAAATGRTPVVAIQHNTMSLNSSANLRDRVIPALTSIALRRADAVVGVSHGVADDLLATTSLPRAKVRAIPNVIDYGRIARLGAEPNPYPKEGPDALPTLVACGRLVRQKGFDVLLSAMAQMRHRARLLLLGEGPDRAALHERAEGLGLADRVVMPGFVANPYPLMRAADVLVLSSRWEGLPTVLLEALRFPVRIVATDCRSGPREILAGLDRAALVPVEDERALAAALDTALDAGPTEGDEAWRRYDEDTVVTAYLDLFREVAGR